MIKVKRLHVKTNSPLLSFLCLRAQSGTISCCCFNSLFKYDSFKFLLTCLESFCKKKMEDVPRTTKHICRHFIENIINIYTYIEIHRYIFRPKYNHLPCVCGLFICNHTLNTHTSIHQTEDPPTYTPRHRNA